MVTVTEITPHSPAEKAGILPGDILLSINGHAIADVLDYRFYLSERSITLKLHRGPDLVEITIKKGEYDDIGLEFETFLMDAKHSCHNKCIFCFIDQLPKGLRDTLYFKDDDSRLSFLMGNYITMTNLRDADVDRIIAMHMSPVNISIHTTNPALRVKMMKNKRAGEVLSYLKRFADAGITINGQIVLCRGINDGEELTRSMRELSELHPAIASVSIVPAGLTCHREGLYPLESFTAEECAAVIAQVEAFAETCRKKCGARLFHCGDEMYLKAGLPLPDEESYEGYPQIENGVGLMTSMRCEFEREFEFIDDYDLAKPRTLSIATGEAAAPFMRSLVAKLQKVCYNFNCEIYPIRNDFFGHNITVAGLVTGVDLIKQLRGKALGDKLLIPSVMLRHEGDLFLCGSSLDAVQAALGVPIECVDNDGAAVIEAILGAPASAESID